MKTIIETITALMVCGLMLVAVLPTITAVQNDLGREIILENADYVNDRGEYAQYYTDNTTVIFSWPEGATTPGEVVITVNGVTMDTSYNYTRHVILDTDALLVETNTKTSTNADNGIFYLLKETNEERSIRVGDSLTLEFNSTTKKIQLTDTTNTISAAYDATYLFTLSDNKQYVYVNTNELFRNVYITQTDIANNTGGVISAYNLSFTVGEDLVRALVVSDIAGTNIYWTSDTYDGILTVKLEFDGLQIADGYTDVYTGGVPKFVIIAGDEVITPSEVLPVRSFVINEVSGHESSGATYSLVGLLPLVAGLGLILSAIGMFVYRRF